MSIRNELERILGKDPLPSPLEFYEEARELLRRACNRGGECDALGEEHIRGDGHGGYMYAADILFGQGYKAAADALLIEWWNDCGTRQQEERQRVYRAVISFKLTDLYLKRGDEGSALWWALHTQADDILGRHEKGGAAGKEQLRTILGVSPEALEKLNEIASRNLQNVEESHTNDWSKPEGFAEDVVVQFALSHFPHAIYFAKETSVTERPISQAYFRSLLQNVEVVEGEKRKGDTLEKLAAYLFLLVPGWIPGRNLLHREHVFETDLLIRNFYRPSNLTAELLGRYFLVECKNWTKSVGVRDVGYFLYRMRLTHAKFGIIFASNDITGSGNDRAAHELIRKAFHEDGCICIVLTKDDLNSLADGRTTFLSLLLDRIEELRFGRPKQTLRTPGLKDIKGIGAKYEERLAEEGIRDIPSLIRADPSSLGLAKGLNEDKVRKWQAEARRLEE